MALTRDERNARRKQRREEHIEEERETRRLYYQKNKDKIKGAVKKYREAHPEVIRAYREAHREEIKDRQRNDALKRFYGITQDEYDAILEKQGGCAICGRKQTEIKKLFSVDHDHKTGKVRGILCHHCNLILGHAQDRRDVLQSAIIYLINTKEA